MLSKQEKQAGINNIANILRAADRTVWSKPGFPPAHRPELDALLKNIVIAAKVASRWQIHPDIKPEYLAQFHDHQRKLDQDPVQNHSAWFDFETGEIVFSESAIRGPQARLRKYVYHEAATSLHNKKRLIEATDYSSEQTQAAQRILNVVFGNRKRPELASTKILRSGFRDYLTVDDLLVGRMYGEGLEEMDEVYPTISEIVTEQIKNRNGDIPSFDRDARSGRLSTDAVEDHREFSRTLFWIMKYFDWRDLLDAFTGDLDQSSDEFRKRYPDTSSGAFVELFRAMQRDEQHIQEANRRAHLQRTTGLIVVRYQSSQ